MGGRGKKEQSSNLKYCLDSTVITYREKGN